MSMSARQYKSFSVYEPVYVNGVTMGLNTNFLYGGGGWEQKQYPTSVHPNWVKRVCNGWKKVTSNVQVTKMLLKKSQQSKTYEVHIHEDQLRGDDKGTRFKDLILNSFRDPVQNCFPTMFVLDSFDGGNIVLFPQKIVYSSDSKMYAFTCADESIITDALHVTDNVTLSPFYNTDCHQFEALGTIEEIFKKLFECAMYNHMRRINLYTVDDTGHAPNVGKLPTGLITNNVDNVTLPLPGESPTGDPQFMYRTMIPSGFKVIVNYRNTTTESYTFKTKKIKLSDAISELDSALKIKTRTSLRFVDGALVLYVNCLSKDPKKVDVKYTNFSVIFDQTNQSTLPSQNYDKKPDKFFDTGRLVAYPQQIPNTYVTDYPFMKTTIADSTGANSDYDDMIRRAQTPTVTYNFENVMIKEVINADLFIGDTITFHSDELARDVVAVVNGYVISFNETNKYSQILEIEVIN